MCFLSCALVWTNNGSVKEKNPIPNHISINSPHSYRFDTHDCVKSKKKQKLNCFLAACEKYSLLQLSSILFIPRFIDLLGLSLFKWFLNLYILKQIMLMLDSLSFLCLELSSGGLFVSLRLQQQVCSERERGSHIPHLALIPFCWVL